MAFESVSLVDDLMVGVDPESPYYDKIVDSISKLKGLSLLLMADRADEKGLSVGQLIESEFVRQAQVGYTEDPDEEALMQMPLDNRESDLMARAMAMGEDEYMVGVAPTNINPLFELATRGGKHRGMFGSLPQTGEEVMVPTLDGEAKTAGYYEGNLLTGRVPVRADYVRDFEGRLALRGRINDAGQRSDVTQQQTLRPVLTDPFYATPEILAHEASHGGEMEFKRARMQDVLPLMAERIEKVGKDRGRGIGEFLAELFEPVGMDEAHTTSGVTDAERVAVQEYLRGEETDPELVTPAMARMLDSLVDYVRGKPEGSVPRPVLRPSNFAMGGRAMGLGSMKKEML